MPLSSQPAKRRRMAASLPSLPQIPQARTSSRALRYARRSTLDYSPPSLSSRDSSSLSDEEKAIFSFLLGNHRICAEVILHSHYVACLFRLLNKTNRRLVNESCGVLKSLYFDDSRDTITSYLQNAPEPKARINIVVPDRKFNSPAYHSSFPREIGPVQLVVENGIPSPASLPQASFLRDFYHSIHSVHINIISQEFELYEDYIQNVHRQLTKSLIPDTETTLYPHYSQRPLQFVLRLHCLSLSHFLKMNFLDDDSTPSFLASLIEELTINGSGEYPDSFQDVSAFVQQISKLRRLKKIFLYDIKIGETHKFLLPPTITDFLVGSVSGELLFSPDACLRNLTIHALSGDRTLLIPNTVRFLKVSQLEGNLIFSSFSQCVNLEVDGGVLESVTTVPLDLPFSVRRLKLCNFNRPVILSSDAQLTKLTLESVDLNREETIVRHPKTVHINEIYGVLRFQSRSQCKYLYLGHVSVDGVVHMPDSVEVLSVYSLDGEFVFPSVTRVTNLTVGRLGSDAKLQIPYSVKILNLKCLHSLPSFPVHTNLEEMTIDTLPRGRYLLVPYTVKTLIIERLEGHLAFPQHSQCTELRIDYMVNGGTVQNPPVEVIYAQGV